MSEKINALQARVDDLRGQLRAAEAELREAKIAAAPVKIGEVVMYRGVEHKVSSIEPQWRKPWVKGYPRKKDGTWSAAERHLYGDWEKV